MPAFPLVLADADFVGAQKVEMGVRGDESQRPLLPPSETWPRGWPGGNDAPWRTAPISRAADDHYTSVVVAGRTRIFMSNSVVARERVRLEKFGPEAVIFSGVHDSEMGTPRIV